MVPGKKKPAIRTTGNNIKTTDGKRKKDRRVEGEPTYCKLTILIAPILLLLFLSVLAVKISGKMIHATEKGEWRVAGERIIYQKLRESFSKKN